MAEREGVEQKTQRLLFIGITDAQKDVVHPIVHFSIN